jgi:hypothetical protein
MKFHIIHRVSCTSPLITVGSILGSHVFVITCILGWDDGTSPTPKVEGMAYDYYAKCEMVPSCPGTPTSPISYSTPIMSLNIPYPIITKDVLVIAPP